MILIARLASIDSNVCFWNATSNERKRLNVINTATTCTVCPHINLPCEEQRWSYLVVLSHIAATADLFLQNHKLLCYYIHYEGLLSVIVSRMISRFACYVSQQTAENVIIQPIRGRQNSGLSYNHYRLDIKYWEALQICYTSWLAGSASPSDIKTVTKDTERGFLTGVPTISTRFFSLTRVRY